jgi:hypothetical protein
MKGNKLRNGILLLLLALLAYIVYDATMQPGTGDLAGDFEEVAIYRNENNTGPVTRIYAVTLADSLWEEMRQYGNYMPHTKYGSTKVYFFLKGRPAPKKVYPGRENFDEVYNPHCLALYEKDAMSSITLRKAPFK